MFWSELRDKARRVVAQLPNVLRGLALIWQATPRHTVAWGGLLVLQGLLPVALVYLTRALVDSLSRAVGQGGSWELVRQPLLLAGLFAGLVLITELLQAANRWIRTSQGELVGDHLSELVQAKAAQADLAYFESSEYFDQLHRIRYDVQHRPIALMENVGGLLQSSLTLAAMLAVLLRFGPLIPLALLASTAPALVVVMRYASRHHAWRLRVTEDERRATYFDWVLTSREHAPEVRLFRLGDHFSSLYTVLRRRLRRERLNLARDEGVAGLGAAAAALGISGGALAWMVWRALAGQVSLGDLAMFYQAFSQGQKLLRALLEHLGQTYGNSLFLDNLFAFLANRPQVVSPQVAVTPPLRPEEGMRFRGVVFRYPGSERVVLDGFDLTVAAGTTVAIVGANGAGKSTLLKLACRFYDPDEGAVELDGVDLRRFTLDELRRRITVLFQEPSRYYTDLAGNVTLGDLERPEDQEGVEAAASAAGADVTARRLPNGWQTPLGRWFTAGHELSVGEWQRVALARAFYRDAPIVLLDEPTSALDSWSEHDWMHRFRALARGKTVLLITHRFTTAMRADTIHVMEEGRIVESGTHRELLRLGGRYASSWNEQVGQ